MNSLNDTIRSSNNNNSNFINDSFKNLNISSSSIGNSGQFQQPVGYTIDNVVSRGNDFKYTFSLPSKEQILNLKQGDLVKLIFTENNLAERMFVEITDLCIYETNSSGEIFHPTTAARRNSGGSDDGESSSSSSSSSTSPTSNTHKDEKNKLVNSQSNSFNNNINSRSISNSNGSNGSNNNNNNNNNGNGNSSGDFGLNIKTIKFTGVLDNNPYQLRSLKLGDRVEFFDYNILSIYNQPNQMFHPDLDSVPGSIKQLFDQLCLVSNRILVDKEHIGYIFREKGTFPNDSGWRIFQGDEPDDYMNKKENYQLVTLASVLNVDDSILLLLGSSIDRHFEYDFESKQWKELVEK